jgi:hypothetical protein
MVSFWEFGHGWRIRCPAQLHLIAPQTTNLGSEVRIPSGAPYKPLISIDFISHFLAEWHLYSLGSPPGRHGNQDFRRRVRVARLGSQASPS